MQAIQQSFQESPLLALSLVHVSSHYTIRSAIDLRILEPHQTPIFMSSQIACLDMMRPDHVPRIFFRIVEAGQPES